MFNAIAYGTDELSSAASTITLGYGPNQTLPPKLLVLTNASAQTVLLPPINTIAPNPPGTPGPITGVGEGFEITIKQGAAGAPTVTANGSDAIDTLTFGGAGKVQTIQASTVNSKWFLKAN